MYTTLVISFIVAIVAMIAGVILLTKSISRMADKMTEEFAKLVNDIAFSITQVTEMKEDLDYAISKLPKSKSKKTTVEKETVSEEPSNTESHENTEE